MNSRQNVFKLCAIFDKENCSSPLIVKRLTKIMPVNRTAKEH